MHEKEKIQRQRSRVGEKDEERNRERELEKNGREPDGKVLERKRAREEEGQRGR